MTEAWTNIPTERLHAKAMQVLDEHIPVVNKKIRSTDAPWMDEPTRKMIKRRRDIYSDRGKVADWYEVKSKTASMVKERKAKYYKKECAKLMEQGSHATPYKVLKNIDCRKGAGPCLDPQGDTADRRRENNC